jgi:hypothetical protein
MLCVPVPNEVGVTVTEQVDTPGVAVDVRLQVPVMVSPESDVIDTFPVGNCLLPVAVSVTVTVAVLPSPTTTEVGERLKEVLVDRRPATTSVAVVETVSLVAQSLPVPPVPVALTVNVVVPGGVEVLVLIVNNENFGGLLALPVSEAGAKVAVAPAGRPMALRLAVQLPLPLKSS